MNKKFIKMDIATSIPHYSNNLLVNVDAIEMINPQENTFTLKSGRTYQSSDCCIRELIKAFGVDV